MKNLSRGGVFNLLIKFFYEKIAKREYSQSKVDQILEKFRKSGLIPESFQYNLLVRREVFNKLRESKRVGA
jgi:hypothetical protein